MLYKPNIKKSSVKHAKDELGRSRQGTVVRYESRQERKSEETVTVAVKMSIVGRDLGSWNLTFVKIF